MLPFEIGFKMNSYAIQCVFYESLRSYVDDYIEQKTLDISFGHWFCHCSRVNLLTNKHFAALFIAICAIIDKYWLDMSPFRRFFFLLLLWLKKHKLFIDMHVYSKHVSVWTSTLLLALFKRPHFQCVFSVQCKLNNKKYWDCVIQKPEQHMKVKSLEIDYLQTDRLLFLLNLNI